MIRIVLFAFFIVLQACSNSSSGNAPVESQPVIAAKDPLIGEWVYTLPDSNNTTGSGILLSLGSEKQIKMDIVYYNKGRQASKFYSRKYIGLYRADSDSIEFVYTYSTCNDLISEKFKVYFQDGKLILMSSDRQKTFTFLKRIQGTYNENLDIQFVEDKGCNQMFTKSDQKKTRAIASLKSKSLFDIFK